MDLNRFSRQVVEIMPLIFREFVRREDNELTRGRISFPQMVALHHLARHEKSKMTDLARLLSVRLSTATVMVDRLVRAGMLRRRHDEDDRRVVWVRVTPKGKKAVGRILEQKRRSVRGIFGKLTGRERSQYLGILLKVKRGLGGATLLLAAFLGTLGPASAAGKDSKIPPPAPLDLSEAYRLALKQSEDVAIRQEALQAAQGHFYQAFEVVLPKIDYSMTRTDQDAPAGASASDSITSTSLRRSTPLRKFTLNQPLFSGFKEFAAIQGAGAEKSQRRHEIRRAKELLFFDVMEAFYAALEAQKDAEILNSIRKLMKDRRAELIERARLGRSRESEAQSAVSDLKLVEAELEEAARRRTLARQLLEFYIGEELKNGLKDTELPLHLLDETSASPARAKDRSDVRAAESAKTLAEKGAVAARAGLLPTVSLDGNYYTKRVGVQSGIDWDVVLKVDVPIFDRLDTFGEIKVAESERETAVIHRRKAGRLAELEIKNAVEDFSAARRIQRKLWEATRASKRNYELQAREYRLNLVNNLQVLEALRNYEDVYRRFNEAYYRMKRAFWALRVALGEGVW
ncbi:MAG: TolC family protein [Candidatus Omnitrophica bacterium]|nr:TolC family protein [Candidatus Omnitrophota bacterium]